MPMDEDPQSKKGQELDNADVPSSSSNYMLQHARRRYLRRFILPYLVFASLWVLLSDLAVAFFVEDQSTRLTISIYKGWGFVCITCLFLYFLLRLESQARFSSEQGLRFAQIKYENVFRNSPDYVTIISHDGIIIDANHTFLRAFGGFSKVLGHNIAELGIWISEEDRNRYLAALEAGGGSVPNFHAKVRMPNGKIQDHLITGFLLKIGSSDFICTSGHDITELRRTEQALRDSEARYRMIADNTDDVIWLYDLRQKRFTYVSPSVQRLRGYTFQEVLEQKFEQALTAESLAQVNKLLPEKIAAYLAGDQRAAANTTEVEQSCKDGSTVSTEVVTRLLPDEKGQPSRILGVSRNITERKKAEQEIKAQKAWLERSERVGKLGGYSGNLATKELWISKEAARICGWDEERPMTIADLKDLPLPEYRKQMDEAMEALVKHGRAYDQEVRIRRHNDGVIVDIHSVAEYDAASQTIVGICQDISARKQVENKSRELATLLDIANDAVYVRTLDHTILYWNKGAQALYGWSSDEALGHFTTDLVSRDHACAEKIQSALLEHGSWSGERAHQTKKGTTVIVFARLTLVRDSVGNPQAVMAINTDITEKKQLEARFMRAQRLENLGALSSGIAHDLNNVLAPVLMSVSLLRDEVQSVSGRTLLATVEASAQRGSEVVKQVLAFARGTQGERTALKPEHLVRETFKIVRETLPKNISVVLSESVDIRPIKGDSTQVHQALMNLCVNARDAMSDGGTLTLGIKNVDVDEGYQETAGSKKTGPYVCIWVSDTGTGIAGAIIEKMFDPFFTTKPAGQGTGLGLSTVLGIMKGHEGFIRVTSSEGKGSLFELFFPAEKQVPVKKRTSEQEIIPRGRGQCVLFVDDEGAVREVASRSLRMYGYTCILASDGLEAVGLFAQHQDKIELLITDLMMPVMDGPSLIRAVRLKSPNLPIIATSGTGDQALLKIVDDLHLAAFLGKPYSTPNLLRSIFHVLAKREEK
jgi:PAS domain S-box-containing protein